MAGWMYEQAMRMADDHRGFEPIRRWDIFSGSPEDTNYVGSVYRQADAELIVEAVNRCKQWDRR